MSCYDLNEVYANEASTSESRRAEFYATADKGTAGIRGSISTGRWTRSTMSSSSRWASAPTLQAPVEHKSKLQSRADRFKTQTKQNEMELLRSPSRGEIDGERR